jgi:hypothetical protein
MAYATISENRHSSKIKKHFSYGIFKLKGTQRKTQISEVLPFRIRFTTTNIRGNYGPGNAAPIGIAVIGVNNYVM